MEICLSIIRETRPQPINGPNNSFGLSQELNREQDNFIYLAFFV
jgi:hypothetical protein